METVYVDILLVTNAVADYFLLMLTSFLMGIHTKRLRLLASAIVASLSSLLIFAPEMGVFIEISVRILASAVIVLMAFGFKNTLRFIKCTALFYASNVILAGGLMLAWNIFRLRGVTVRNGAVFYNISPAVFVLSTAVVYTAVLVISKIADRRRINQGEYSITLRFCGKSVCLQGIVDSGNMLRDAVSGSPVIICDYERVKPLFSPELNKIFSRENFEQGFYEDIMTSGVKDRFRVIPYNSVSDSGLMAALVLDGAEIIKDKKNEKIDKIIMAVTHKKIANGEFDVLINPELITV